MAFAQKLVMRGALWTIGAYGASVSLRFGSNVILSRLVMPEVFGVMLIINTLRNGIELISDVGIGQNIVHNPQGETRSFRDTAWTIQLLRGVVLFSALFLAASSIAEIYRLPAEAIQLSAVTLVFMGAASTSIYLLQRRLQFVRLNLFDLGIDFIGAVLVVGLALYSPTIWSLITAHILMVVVRLVGTFLLPESRNWFAWNPAHARQILSFGKWIYLSSLLAFLAASFDKLYLGQSIPLAMLGIYGLARNVADLPTALFARLGHSLVFPVIAAEQESPRGEMRGRLSPLRLKLLFVAAACLAFGIAFGDFAIRIIYDARYAAAGWMLPVMLAGVWAAILCSMNEYVLIGLGKPLYGALGNLAKLIGLAIGIPVGLHLGGLGGAILAVALADCCRYLPILLGQRRETVSFLRQDIALSSVMVALVCLFTVLRGAAGFGSAFDGFLS